MALIPICNQITRRKLIKGLKNITLTPRLYYAGQLFKWLDVFNLSYY